MDILEAVKRYQKGDIFHEFTCGGGGGLHSGQVLDVIETPTGIYLFCPHGDHNQRLAEDELMRIQALVEQYPNGVFGSLDI